MAAVFFLTPTIETTPFLALQFAVQVLDPHLNQAIPSPTAKAFARNGHAVLAPLCRW
jgi:hypothetical protein